MGTGESLFDLQRRPGVRGSVDPSADPGELSGRLHYYPDVTVSQPDPARTFRFDAPSWTRRGERPFVWDYIPPTDTGQFPIVRIAAARSVRIKPGIPDEVRRLPDADRSHFGRPVVEIIRLQNDHLLPEPGDPIKPRTLIDEPVLWYEGADPPAVPVSETSPFRPVGSDKELAIVRSKPRGMRAKHVQNHWQIEVQAPKYQRAAFAYEIVPPDQPEGYVLRLVRTENVQVDFRLSVGPEGPPQVFLEQAVVPRLTDVPRQGSHLPSSGRGGFDFEYYPDDKIDVSLTRQFREMLFSFADASIGVIPYFGDIYDISHFLWALATGETFWGTDVTESELALMGVAACLPLVSGGVRGVNAAIRTRVQSWAEQSDVASALAEPMAYQVTRQRLDPALLDAVEGLSFGKRTELVRQLKKYSAGEAGARQILETFEDAVGNRYLANLDRQRLRRVFSDDFEGFRDPILSEGYQRYRSKHSRPDSAPVWAKRQTRGRYARRLEASLGREYRKIIRRSLENQTIPDVTDAARKLFDKLGGRIDEYRSLVSDRSTLAGAHGVANVGRLFEVDHLLERRFFRSPRVEDHIDEDDVESMLVPKNPAVARQMEDRTFGYVHSTKTAQLRQLIPNGQEDLFTMQEWWDAHAYVLVTSGAPDGALDGLANVLNPIAAAAGEPVNFSRRRIGNIGPSHFLPENGWGSLQVPASN